MQLSEKSFKKLKNKISEKSERIIFLSGCQVRVFGLKITVTNSPPQVLVSQKKQQQQISCN